MKKAAPKEMLKFRADATLRRAIKLRAALLDKDMQDVIVEVLVKGLAAEIKEVQDRGLVDGPPSDANKPSRRRKDTDPEK